MRCLKLGFVFSTVFLLALAASPAFAIRVYFDLSGLPGPPTVGGVPTITLPQSAIGTTQTLNVWLTPDPRGTAAPFNNQVLNGVAFDILSTNPAVLARQSFTMRNPDDTQDFAFDGKKRFDAVTEGVVSNPTGPSGSERLVQNASGTAAIVGRGVGNTPPLIANDTDNHKPTQSFLIGTLQVQITGTGRTGLYFQTGSSLFSMGTACAPIQFGNTNTTYCDDNNSTGGSGDPITGDLAQADAIIEIQGTVPTVSVSLTNHDGTDTTSGDARLINSPFGTFVNVGPGTSGRVNVVNYHGEPGGALTLFFDLVNDGEAQGLVDSLNALAGGFTASVRSFTGVNATTPGNNDGDIALVFPNRPAGSDSFIDFNFGGIQVQAVGIPEPSTYVLASVGVLGLALVRRNRRRG